MIQIKVKDIAEKLGLRAEELTDEMLDKVETFKDSLDKEMRRQCRLYWSVISAVCLVVGIAVGWLI